MLSPKIVLTSDARTPRYNTPVSALPVYEAYTVDTALGAVSYRQSGHGSAIVFLHGLSGNSRSFSKQFAAFSKRYRTIAWDAPGYGNTAIVDSNIDTYADQVIALLDALKLPRATLVGHSMGGVVAARVAARHAARVNALLLSCTHTGYAKPANAAMTDGHRQRIDEIARMDPLDYGRARAQSMLAPGASAQLHALIADLAAHTTSAGLESAIRAIFTADNVDGTSKLDQPVTIVAGAHDTIAPAEKTRHLASIIKQCHHVIMSEAAHAPYIEMPDAFDRVLQALLNRIEPARR